MQVGPRGGKLVGRLIATTKDARAAGRSEEAIKALVAMLRTALSEIKEGPGVELAKMLIDVFDHGTLTRDGAIVRGKIEVPARFFQLFMDLATAKEKAEAPPTLPPLPSRYAPPSRPRS